MFTQEELQESPAYLLTLYQNEIFREVHAFMQANGMTQKELAKKLGVSDAYVSQILNGRFNFTLKKLIELGIMIGKIPLIKFVSPKEVFAKAQEVHDLDASIADETNSGPKERLNVSR